MILVSDWISDVCFFFFKQKTAYEIGRAHVCTPVTDQSRMPSSAWQKNQLERLTNHLSRGRVQNRTQSQVDMHTVTRLYHLMVRFTNYDVWSRYRSSRRV